MFNKIKRATNNQLLISNFYPYSVAEKQSSIVVDKQIKLNNRIPIHIAKIEKNSQLDKVDFVM